VPFTEGRLFARFFFGGALSSVAVRLVLPKAPAAILMGSLGRSACPRILLVRPDDYRRPALQDADRT